jgi:hypothetical protein
MCVCIDELFAFAYAKADKNMEDCITYILNTVKRSGCNGFTDEEVYSMAINEEEIQRLRELKLVAGVASELQVAGNYTKISYQDYKQMILDLIYENGSATREEIVNLIMPTLSPDEAEEKRLRKITNIVAKLSKQEKLIKNTSNTDKYPVWKLA